MNLSSRFASLTHRADGPESSTLSDLNVEETDSSSDWTPSSPETWMRSYPLKVNVRSIPTHTIQVN